MRTLRVSRRASVFLFPVLLAVVWSAALPASAGQTYWQHDPCTPGDWFDANNWTAGVPTAGDWAYVDNGGTAEISYGQAEAYGELVGHSGTGTIRQVNARNVVGDTLYVGSDHYAHSNGTYELSGTGQLWAQTEFVAWYPSGGGRFVQTGGTNTVADELVVGSELKSDGTYELNGRAQLWATRERVVQGGRFVQTGGLNTVRGVLKIDGRYELSGTGRLRVTGEEQIGFEGATAALVQHGGTHMVAGEMSLGDQEGSTGTYELRSGELVVDDDLVVGDCATGIFIQSGGTVSVRGRLEFGDEEETCSGTYELTGGLLVAEDELIGDNGSGTFLQTGGENRILKCLEVGDSGQYVLRGGILQVGWSLDLDGEWDFGANSVDVTWENVVVDFSDGNVLNAEKASLTLLGANTLVILAPGQDPNEWFQEYTNEGRTHITNGPLVVPAGTTRAWRGMIRVPVHCEGTLSAPPGDGLVLLGDLTIDGNGAVLLGPGELTVGDGVSRLDGNGRLQADEEIIGQRGTATFIQTGGTNTVGELGLGDDEEDVGTYRLEGGLLQADEEGIGDEGCGVF
ncbi:MAG: hypothetical protein WBF17_02515, partial [Phycisphaerae bacterium]